MRTHLRPRPVRTVAVLAAVLALAACSGDGDDVATPEATDDASGAQLADGTDPGADDASMAADGGDMLAPDGEVPADDSSMAADGGDMLAPDGEVPTPDGAAGDLDGGAVPPLLPVVDGWPETTVTLAGDAPTTVAAKVAAEVDRRQQGLMNVEVLPDGVGMLFLFDELRTGGFWMKDTLVPLDIAYIAGDEVVSVLQMDPCEADPCPSYDPGVEYDAALEVNQGALAEAGVTEGTTVTWTEPVEVGP